MIDPRRIQEIFDSKDTKGALEWCNHHGNNECWGYIDGVLVIYDDQDPPLWLQGALRYRDEDGNTPGFNPPSETHDTLTYSNTYKRRTIK